MERCERFQFLDKHPDEASNRSSVINFLASGLLFTMKAEANNAGVKNIQPEAGAQ